MTTNWETVTHEGETGVFEVQYCRTSHMLADLFTKNLPAQTFNALADFVTGRRGDYSAEPLVTDDGRAMLIYLAQ